MAIIGNSPTRPLIAGSGDGLTESEVKAIRKILETEPNVNKVIKVTTYNGKENSVPVPTNEDKPVGGQIANVVIKNNQGATINDFLVPDSSVVVTKKPIEGKDDASYQYGVYTAKLNGAGIYKGTLDITGYFGTLKKTLKNKNKK